MVFVKKKDNEKGLMMSCEHCSWRYPVFKDDNLAKINQLFVEHKCTEFPIVEKNIELNQLTEKELLVAILTELKRK